MSYTADYNGRVYQSLFDRSTQTWIQTSPEGRVQTQSLDTRGRVTLSQTPGLADIRYSYDDRGRPTLVTEGEGNDARITRFTYDSDGFLASITDPLQQVVTTQRDAIGRVTSRILEDQRQIDFAYNENDNVVGMTAPGRPEFLYNYSPTNLTEGTTAPDAGDGPGLATYSHNLDRQISQAQTPAGEILSFSYSEQGKINGVTTPEGTVTYGYNPASGQLSNIAAPHATLGYSYDGMLLTDETWSGGVSGSVSRTFNNDFLITQQRINGTFDADYGYDDDGLLTQAGSLSVLRDADNGLVTGTSAGVISTTYSYNEFGELDGRDTRQNNNPLYSVTYTRDPLGRITGKTETLAGNGLTEDYRYDLTGRLIEVIQGGQTVAIYTYDAHDNRETLTPAGAAAVNATLDAQDKLRQYGDIAYTYDDNGALASRTDNGQTTLYRYDVMGNLRQVTLEDATEIAYQIDGQDRRIGKTRNGTVIQGFLYDGQYNPVAELDSSGAVVSRFIYGPWDHVPVAMDKGGERYRLISDHLGSVRLVVNEADGSVVQRLDYDPWGNVLQDTNPGFQPFGYAGGLFDRDTQLVRFGHRDYDPHTGRWTAPDSFGHAGGDTNLYAYVYNDPINNVDPSGQFLPIVAGCIAGAAMEYAFERVVRGRSNSCVNWTNVALGGAMGCVGGINFSWLSKFLNKACNSFSEDTLVHTEQGVKVIAKIKQGDKVLAYDEASGANSYEPVLEVIQSTRVQDFVLITLDNGNTLNATADHPFYIQGKGWRLAKTLKAGVTLQAYDGKTIIIKEIATQRREETVYNLTVSRTHNFYVGQDGVLVHNAACGWKPPAFEKHHTIPREIQKRLPPSVRNHPDVRGRRGLPNRKSIPYSTHRNIHKGAGGGHYNQRFDQKIEALGGYDNVSPSDITRIRDQLVRDFNL